MAENPLREQPGPPPPPLPEARMEIREKPGDRLRHIISQTNLQRKQDVMQLADIPSIHLDTLSDEGIRALTTEQRIKVILESADLDSPDKLADFVTDPKIKQILSDLQSKEVYPREQQRKEILQRLQRKYHFGNLLAITGIQSLATLDKKSDLEERVRRGDFTREAGYMVNRGVFLAIGNQIGTEGDVSELLADTNLDDELNAVYPYWLGSKDPAVNLYITLNLATNPNVGADHVAALLQKNFLRYSTGLASALSHVAGGPYYESDFYDREYKYGTNLSRLIESFGIFIPDMTALYEQWGLRKSISSFLDQCEALVASDSPQVVKHTQGIYNLIKAGQICPSESERYRFLLLLAKTGRSEQAEYLINSWPLQIAPVITVKRDRFGKTSEVIIDVETTQRLLAEAKQREIETQIIADLIAERNPRGRLDAIVEELVRDETIQKQVAHVKEQTCEKPQQLPTGKQDSILKRRTQVGEQLTDTERFNGAYIDTASADLGVFRGDLRQRLNPYMISRHLPDIPLPQMLQLGGLLRTLLQRDKLPLNELPEDKMARVIETDILTSLPLPQLTHLADVLSGRKTVPDYLKYKTRYEITDLLVDSMVKHRHICASPGLTTYTAHDLVDPTLAFLIQNNSPMHQFYRVGGSYLYYLRGDPTMVRSIDRLKIRSGTKRGSITLVSAPAGSGKSSLVRALDCAVRNTFAGGLGMVDQLSIPISEEGTPALALTPDKAISDYDASTFASGVRRVGLKLKELFLQPSTEPVIINLDEILVGTVTPERVRLTESLILAYGQLFPLVNWVVISHDTQRYYRSLSLLQRTDSDAFPEVYTTAVHPETHQPLPDTIADGMGIHVAKREGMPQTVITIAQALEEAVNAQYFEPLPIDDYLPKPEEIQPTETGFITEEELSMLGFDSQHTDQGVYQAVYRICDQTLYQGPEDSLPAETRRKMANDLVLKYAGVATSLLVRPKTDDISQFHRLVRKYQDMNVEGVASAMKKIALGGGDFSFFSPQSDIGSLDTYTNIAQKLRTAEADHFFQKLADTIVETTDLSGVPKQEILTQAQLLDEHAETINLRLTAKYIERYADYLTSALDEKKIKEYVATEDGKKLDDGFVAAIQKGADPLDLISQFLCRGNTSLFCTLLQSCALQNAYTAGIEIKDGKLTNQSRTFLTQFFNPEATQQKVEQLFRVFSSSDNIFDSNTFKKRIADFELRDILTEEEQAALDKLSYYSDLQSFAVVQGAIMRKDSGLEIPWSQAKRLPKGVYPIQMKEGYDLGLAQHLKRGNYIPRDISLPEDEKQTHIMAYRGPNMAGKTQGMITDAQMFVWDRLTGGYVPAQECSLGEVDALQVSVNTANAANRLSTFMAESKDKARKVRKALYMGSLGKTVFAAIDEPFNGIGEQDKSVLAAAFTSIYRKHYLALTNHDPLLNQLLNQITAGGLPLPWDIGTVVPGFRIGNYGKTDLSGSYSEAPEIFKQVLLEIGYPAPFVDHILHINDELRKLDELAYEKQKQMGY